MRPEQLEELVKAGKVTIQRDWRDEGDGTRRIIYRQHSHLLGREGPPRQLVIPGPKMSLFKSIFGMTPREMIRGEHTKRG